MADSALPAPLEEEQEEDGGVAAPLMALLRQQQAQRTRENAALQQAVGLQRARAQGVRSLGLLSSFGSNPLLRNLQGEAGQQAGAFEGMAARMEGRMDAGRDLDPLGIARLQQAAEKMAQDRALAMERLGFQKEAAEAKAEAARQKAAAGAGKKAKTDEEKHAEKLWKAAESMRKEFSTLPDVKEFTPFKMAYQGLRSALSKPGGVGSTAAIFNFMKLIDPGVAVMEGDVERIRASAGPAAKFADLYEYAKSGNTLPATVRTELEGMAGELYGIRKSQYETRRKQYRDLAKKRGVAPDDVLPPLDDETPQRAATRTPAATAMPTGAGGALSLEDVPTPPGAEEMVPMISPKGARKMVPRSKVDAALKTGGRLADG
jgi:hypothetical protein